MSEQKFYDLPQENLNTLDALFQLNKSFIMSSKFQNNLYKGKKVCEYFGEKPTTFRVGGSFAVLLDKMLDKLPTISYEKLLKNRAVYEKYPHLYLRFIGKHNYLVNIGAFCQHLDTYAESPEIPVNFCLPSFFSRYYTVCWYNINTQTGRTERFAAPNGGVPTKANDLFLHLFYFDEPYEQILETTNWADYESLRAELKNANRKQN